MKNRISNLALKTPHAVTYGAGSLCRGDVLGAIFVGKVWIVMNMLRIGKASRKAGTLPAFLGINQ